MAAIEADFYDYNGVLFCHGKISDTGSYTCSYVIMTVGGSYKYKTYIKDPDGFPGIFNINTYSHAIESSPQTIDSGTYIVCLAFYTSLGVELYNDYLYSNSSRIDYKMHNTLYSPQWLLHDKEAKTITVANEGTGRYYLEIRRRNRNKINTEYTETEKDYFYTTLMKGTEGGKYYEGIPHTSLWGQGHTDDDGNLYEPIPKARYQWRDEIPTIILFDSAASFTTSKKTEYYNLACEALDDLAEITGKSFTLRDMETRSGNTDFWTCVNNDFDNYYRNNDNSYCMMIRFGTDSTANLEGQGRWGNYCAYDPFMGITTSHAVIAVDMATENETLKHVVYEEIMQSLGMGNDSHSQETSLHWDPHWSNPESYTGIDKRILELVCSTDVCAWSGFDFLNKWDTPCILFQDYTGSDLVFDVSGLNDNEEYYAWAWIAREVEGGGVVGGSSLSGGKTQSSGTSIVADGWDNDTYSMRTQYEFDTKPVYEHPGRFVWIWAKDKGVEFNLTAVEWNAFQEHIQKMLLYKLGDGHGYEPNTVSEGETFTAGKYNEAGDAIKKIEGYGTYIPTVVSGENITADKGSDIPKENMMNVIVDELNAIS